MADVVAHRSPHTDKIQDHHIIKQLINAARRYLTLSKARLRTKSGTIAAQDLIDLVREPRVIVGQPWSTFTTARCKSVFAALQNRSVLRIYRLVRWRTRALPWTGCGLSTRSTRKILRRDPLCSRTNQSPIWPLPQRGEETRRSPPFVYRKRGKI
eukprot:COSAG02_NODE_13481_length_1389_cov_1.635659_1_plen_155_part_00